jgi:hypothetical protein
MFSTRLLLIGAKSERREVGDIWGGGGQEEGEKVRGGGLGRWNITVNVYIYV